MEAKLPCEKHNEQLRVLFKKADDFQAVQKTLYSLDKNLALQSQLMQAISEHNQRQDLRMDKQQEIIEKINLNLTELTEGQRRTNEELKSLGSRINKVEDRIDTSEEKHSIDLRDIQKKKYTDALFKYGLPIGGGIVILLKMLEVLLQG